MAKDSAGGPDPSAAPPELLGSIACTLRYGQAARDMLYDIHMSRPFRNSARNATLAEILHSLDGKNYGVYKSLRGNYRLENDIVLRIDSVQADPYAPPSLMRVIIDHDAAKLPHDVLADRVGHVATADYLTRRFAHLVRDIQAISIGQPCQAVLERTSIKFTGQTIEARITVALPASGRRIRGREAAYLLTSALPKIVRQSLFYEHINGEELAAHVALLRDQEALRKELASRKLIAFIGNGSILPRQSGDSDIPLEQHAIPFESPTSLEASFELPSGRTITGMAIPEGITVIVGGGFHGKSTLLRAIERGVYPHIAGDGREWVITRPSATAIRAEDGRAVTGVDISTFINNLPSGADTRQFYTTNASGSTSQAANLMEAVEAGACALLIDEDTAATNFMIRDELMSQLIPANDEPITPFVQRVQPLYESLGVSTILVAGGSSAFFCVADRVIALNKYRPTDVTERAHELAGATKGSSGTPIAVEERIPAALHAPGKTKPARALGRTEIRYGKEIIQLSALTQIIDTAQTTAIAHALDAVAEMCDHGTLRELVSELDREIEERGLDAISPFRGHPGLFARPRTQEIMATVNRYRRLKLKRH